MKNKLLLVFLNLLFSFCAYANPISFKETSFFKKGDDGKKLYQVSWVNLNDSIGQNVKVRFFVSGELAFENSYQLQKGDNNIEILFPEVSSKQDAFLEVYNKNKKVAEWKGTVSPQKKWTIHCVTYSHQDLGYGDIPHRLRRENRNENIDMMLKYCKETDSWPYDSQYRAVMETSESLTTYMTYCNKKNAEELKRRVEEGRIQIGGIQSTVNTETLSHEMMARLFYLSNRHAVDMFGIDPSISVNFDDVIGITLPFFTYAKEAGIKNLFHGYNSPRMKFQLPAQDDPVYYMKGADGDDLNKVLVRSYYYSGDAIRSHNSKMPLGEDVVQGIMDRYSAQNWPFDVLLSQDGWDFTLLTIDNAKRIKDLNEKYAYPRMICSTMDMFFTDVREQLDKYDVKSYQLDGNNQWADQPASDSFVLGQARILDDLIPIAEKLSSINYYTSGGLSLWDDIYQAYHRLLLYHEHTCGSSAFKPAYQYANEREEIATMVKDAKEYCYKVLNASLSDLSKKISLKKDNSLIVFNPINLSGSFNVCFESNDKTVSYLVDEETKDKISVQNLDGKISFVASLPSFGYKVYSIKYDKKNNSGVDDATSAFIGNGYKIENSYYRLVFDSLSGSISSLYDKELSRELLDKKSPYKLNEYLYERYEVPGKEDISTFYGAEMTGCKVYSTPIADVVKISQAGEGCRSINQEIMIYKGIKKIDFKMTINKSSSGRTQRINDSGSNTNKEAIYIALPFDVPNYKFAHSLPGMKIEPIVSQFDSVATASYAMRNYTSVYNDEFGVVVSPIEASLVQYGHPRSDAIYGFWGTEHIFEKNKSYPENSSIFMYLLNNMFDVNLILTQPGIKEYNYSLTSFKSGDSNFAENFGWRNHAAPHAVIVNNKQDGVLDSNESSFVVVDKDNVICTAFKLAEINGEGYILRFVETSGKATEAKVSLPLFNEGFSVNETNLVEDDCPNGNIAVTEDGTFNLSLSGFGVKTIRVYNHKKNIETPKISTLAESDMRVRLNIENYKSGMSYKVFRSEHADFVPSLLSYVGETKESVYVDSPRLNYGNWIDNVLYPETQYYYKVIGYDNWNNSSEVSNLATVETLSQAESNDTPLQVSGLKVVLVSDVSEDNYLNVHWRSNCEPDIVKYNIYRGESADFEISPSTKIGSVDVNNPGNGSKFKLREYDHQMFVDRNVLKNKCYYYVVRAVDALGKESPIGTVASGKTKY